MQSSEIISPIGRKHLRLQMTDEIGPVRFSKLVGRLGGVDAVLAASATTLCQADGIGSKTADAIARSRDSVDVAGEIERAERAGCRIICRDDADYPASLKHISDPPICLYVRGTIIPTDAVALAIVGSRRCSHYGLEQSFRFGERLAQAGFTIVSGLARGIDGQAHQGALRAGGRTLAILGNGLSTVYPPEHADLSERIVEQGALISELPVATTPDAKNFPGRNRIIVGLCLGVLIVEAGQRSGALISARLANEYNREVFAIPGRVDTPDTSAGTNGLIRDGGAKLVTCMEDILDELDAVGEVMGQDTAESTDAGAAPMSRSAMLSPEEQRVVEVVDSKPVAIEQIAQQVGLPAGRVSSLLMGLQLKGYIRQMPGQRYVRR